MTNYNERLDEILSELHSMKPSPMSPPDFRKLVCNDAKQALTSLTKELVEYAKPKKKPQFFCQGCDKSEERGYNQAIKEFEQNLLKALEEK